MIATRKNAVTFAQKLKLAEFMASLQPFNCFIAVKAGKPGSFAALAETKSNARTSELLTVMHGAQPQCVQHAVPTRLRPMLGQW